MSPTSRPASEPSLPAVHVHHLVELVGRFQVGREELLRGLGLDETALDDPGTRIPLPTIIRLTERARELTAEPGLGFYLGMRMRISVHGYLGFAAMAAGTLREAAQLAVRFAPTRTTAIALRLHEENGSASLVIEERAPLGSARDVFIFALAVGLWQCGCALTGQVLRGSIDVSFPEPEYFKRFAEAAPGGVRFGQPCNQLLIAPGSLDLPLTMADPVALRLAREQCERELDALGQGGKLSGRARAQLVRSLETAQESAEGEGGVPSIDEMSRRLHVSVRTLKRRLASEGTTYSDLVEGERRERAFLLLRSADLSIAEIADRLGYSDAANFTRAFRRWTGQSPRAFQKKE